MYELVEDMPKIPELQVSGKMDAQPSGRRRLDAKRHYVILAKALDGIWPVGHACAVLCWGTSRKPPCPSTALHRHDQLAKYHPVPWLRCPNVSWYEHLQ